MNADQTQTATEEEGGVVLSGFCTLTLTARAVNHADYAEGMPPEIIRHQIVTTIPDNGCGKRHMPQRVWSPGFMLGMEMARATKPLRHFFADWEDVSEGFAYEMGDEI